MGIFLLLIPLVTLTPCLANPLATKSFKLKGKPNSTVENVVNLIGKGFDCSIAPLDSVNIDKDDLKVFCDTDRYTCYSCTVNTDNHNHDGIEDQSEDIPSAPTFSRVTRSVVSVVANLMDAGRMCGVTAVQAHKINIAGVKALCGKNFCFLCESRDIIDITDIDANVFKVTKTLLKVLESKTSSGHSCGITTRAIKDIDTFANMEETVVCDENVCIRCDNESLFDHIPEDLKKKVVEVSRHITDNVKDLIANDFSCGVTTQESTEIDSADLKIVCENKLCFLCYKQGAKDLVAAIVDVEAVPVSEDLLAATSQALHDKRACAISFENKTKFKADGLDFFCDVGICFICDAK